MSVINQNIVSGWDPTGATSIDQAGLAALVSNATLAIDKGLVIKTTDVSGVTDVPNAYNNANWKRFIWIRQGAVSTGVYVWNEAAGDTDLLKWQSIIVAGIGVGTIKTEMVAANAITDEKIASGISYSKLSGAPTGLAPSGTAGGSLAGTYPNPTIKNGVITADAITDGTITGAKHIAGSTSDGITIDKLKIITVAGTSMRINAAANAWETFVSNNINDAAKLAVPNAGGTDDGKAVCVNSGAAGTFKYTALSVTAKQTTALVAVPGAGATATLTHTLGSIPTGIRVVLRCKADDAATGYVIGDELDLNSAFAGGGNGLSFTYFVPVGTATTEIKVIACSTGTFNLYKKSNGVLTAVTAAGNFELKAYLTLVP